MLIRHNEDDLDKVFRQKLYNATEEAPVHLWEGIRQRNPRKRRGFMWWMLPATALVCAISAFALHEHFGKESVIAQSIAKRKVDQQEVWIPAAFKQGLNSSLVKEDITLSSNSLEIGKGKVVATDNRFRLNTSSGKHNKSYRHSTQDFRTNLISADKQQHVAVSINKISEAKMAELIPEILSQEEYPRLIFADAHLKRESLLSDAIKNDIEQDVFSGGLPLLELVKNQTPLRWSIGMYYLISQPVRIKQPRAEQDAYTHFTDRTKLDVSNGFGVVLGYSFHENLSISAGLEYQRFHENHIWIDSALVQNRKYVFEYDTTISFTGTTITQYVSDSIISNEWTTTWGQRVNRYSFVNIPVLLSWNYRFQKYSVGIELGPVFKVNSVYNGEFVFANWVSMPPVSNAWYETADAATVKESRKFDVPVSQVYRHWQTDIHVGIHQSYMLTPKLGALLSLQTRIMTKDARTSGDIAHRFIQPGIRVGLNYFIK